MAGYCTLVLYFHSPVARENTAAYLCNIQPYYLLTYQIIYMYIQQTHMHTHTHTHTPTHTHTYTHTHIQKRYHVTLTHVLAAPGSSSSPPLLAPAEPPPSSDEQA